MTMDEFFDRRIPLAMAAAVLLQGGAVVWWAACKDSDDHFQQRRLDHLEQAATETRDAQTQVIERLARIEERLNAENYTLDRIQKQIGVSRR